VVVVALLVIAATGVQTSAGAPSRHTRTSLVSVGQWLIGFAVTGGLVLLVIGMLTMRSAPRAPRRSTSTAALIAYLMIGFGVLFLLARGRHGVLTHRPRPASGTSGGASGSTKGTSSTYLPAFPWVWFLVTVALLAIAFAVTFMILERRRPRAARGPRPRKRDAEVEADDDTLIDLARHGEPRAAVRACYEITRRMLAEDGVGPEEWEAPREYAARVTLVRPEQAPALRELTTLYERARFSAAAVDEPARAAALAVVERLRAARAAPSEDAATIAVRSSWSS
jgi:hypothetical protein